MLTKKPRVSETTAQLLIEDLLETKDLEKFLRGMLSWSNRFGFGGGRRTRLLFINEIIRLMKEKIYS